MKVRPIEIDGDVAYVTLTRGKVAVIDATDVALVDGKNWHADLFRYTFYARHTINSEGVILKMHRLIMAPAPCEFVDHIDGDGLNNRRSNLRIATVAQNNRNQRLRKNNTSGFKGVSFHKEKQKWQSTIWVDSKIIHLGEFGSPEVAHAAYAQASARLHGEFGRSF